MWQQPQFLTEAQLEVHECHKTEAERQGAAYLLKCNLSKEAAKHSFILWILQH